MAGKTSLHGQWVWIMEVIFGGIGVFAFRTLSGGVQAAFEGGFGDGLFHLYVAGCLLVFYLYDVLVWHRLSEEFGCGDDPLGMARIFLDLVMAFALLLVVATPMEHPAEAGAFTLLLAAVAWHLLAVLWHALAHLRQERVPRGAVGPALWHGVCVLAYLLVVTSLAGSLPLTRASVATKPVTAGLCTAILVAAVARSAAVYRGRG